MPRPTRGRFSYSPGKKTADAIRQEVAFEIEILLKVVFTGRRQTGSLDLEAVETAARAAMHRAGAAVPTHVLSENGAVATAIACPCGKQARCHGRRRRRVLTAVGEATVERSYYYCPHCHRGQSPRDHELDIVDTDYSPGVRRMMAVVGGETSFDRGRAQMELLAGLTVTRKAVERHAEAIGDDIAKRELAAVQRALQFDLPVVAGPRIPVLYIGMDGTGVPVVSAETAGRKGKNGDTPAHTREVKLGAVFTQTTVDKDGRPRRDPASTTYTGAIETAEEFGGRLYTEAWDRVTIGAEAWSALSWIRWCFRLRLWPIAPRKKSSSVMVLTRGADH